jgi:hypothetical protein
VLSVVDTLTSYDAPAGEPTDGIRAAAEHLQVVAKNLSEPRLAVTEPGALTTASRTPKRRNFSKISPASPELKSKNLAVRFSG